MKFTWGDQIKIKDDAPFKYRPGEFGVVCGMWNIKNESISNEYGMPINSLMYIVEYLDGTDCQVPEDCIEYDNVNYKK